MKVVGVYSFHPSSLEHPLEFFQYFLLPFFHKNGGTQTSPVQSRWSIMVAFFALIWTFNSCMVIFRWLANLQNSGYHFLPRILPELSLLSSSSRWMQIQTCLLCHKVDFWTPDLNAINKRMVLQDNALRNSTELTWCYCLLFKQTFSLCLITESHHCNGIRPSYIQGFTKPVTLTGLPLTWQNTWLHLNVS